MALISSRGEVPPGRDSRTDWLGAPVMTWRSR